MRAPKTIFLLTIFSIAMGYMESAVVVYLREIFYPDGFEFPLRAITQHLAVTEIIREAATLVMLITIAMLSGRTKTEGFGFFIFCFAVWDITYYVVLYFLLGWPPSLFTWDILFLIPLTWVGPVLGPVINSISMILFALAIVHFTSVDRRARISALEWLLLVLGSVIVIISYTEDYAGFMRSEFSWGELLFPGDASQVMEFGAGYIPQTFAWWIFWLGESTILLAIVLFYRRNNKK